MVDDAVIYACNGGYGEYFLGFIDNNLSKAYLT
jgi:hypothetical protein